MAHPTPAQLRPRGRPTPPIRLAVFDMDMTLLNAESLDELARDHGVHGEVADLTRRAMAGEMGFGEALRRRVALLRGMEVGRAQGVADRLPLMPGAHGLLGELKARGVQTAMITGGFGLVARRVARELSIGHVVCNELEARGGLLTGRATGPLTGSGGKEKVLNGLARQLGVSPRECLVVGDGANDLEMFRVAGLAVAFGDNPVLRQAAALVIPDRDLSRLTARLRPLLPPGPT